MPSSEETTLSGKSALLPIKKILVSKLPCVFTCFNQISTSSKLCLSVTEYTITAKEELL